MHCKWFCTMHKFLVHGYVSQFFTFKCYRIFYIKYTELEINIIINYLATIPQLILFVAFATNLQALRHSFEKNQ